MPTPCANVNQSQKAVKLSLCDFCHATSLTGNLSKLLEITLWNVSQSIRINRIWHDVWGCNKQRVQKLDEINGVKIKAGHIKQRRPSWWVLSLPYVPIDSGFSFYEAYSQIPILFLKKESGLYDYENTCPNRKLIEEVGKLGKPSQLQRPLKDFAEEQELKSRDASKDYSSLEEQGIDFDRLWLGYMQIMKNFLKL